MIAAGRELGVQGAIPLAPVGFGALQRNGFEMTVEFTALASTRKTPRRARLTAAKVVRRITDRSALRPGGVLIMIF